MNPKCHAVIMRGSLSDDNNLPAWGRRGVLRYRIGCLPLPYQCACGWLVGRLGPMPFRDSHRYRGVHKHISGLLSVVYACTFVSSTPLSWGCETILSSRRLPSGLC